MAAIPRSEHPRPDFERDNWLCLNGEWDFSMDEKCYDRKIIVPFACETELSGIGEKEFHKTVWYRRTFRLPERMKGKKILLHFGAVDYSCMLWVNGGYIREHTGGQTSFYADITDSLNPDGENSIELKVQDDHEDLEMPRGKQYWEEESRGIFYTRTTGIWQSVWIEAVDPLHLISCRITPRFDEKSVCFEYCLSKGAQSCVEFIITFDGRPAARVSASPEGKKGMVCVRLDQSGLRSWNFEEELSWTPETPRLFDVVIRTYDNGRMADEVKTYFGMRKVSVDNGKFMLNNREYYQKLILDQGYWESSLLTAPSDEAFIKDIELTKAMGFNGVRKHQKVEDPRYLYHADRLGLLVWGEIGSAYEYSREYAGRMYGEWMEMLERDYNHPCIVAWTPLNESWGVQEIKTDKYQQAHCNALMYMTKSVDTTRVVMDNDGWEHTCGDLLTIHDYTSSGKELGEHFKSMESVLALCPGRRSLFADGWDYQGQPVLLTEFGGIRYTPRSAVKHSWGYCDAKDAQMFLKKYAEIMRAVYSSPVLQGYCYTQLTDIETEENGLLTYGREPKLPIEAVRAVNDGYGEEYKEEYKDEYKEDL